MPSAKRLQPRLCWLKLFFRQAFQETFHGPVHEASLARAEIPRGCGNRVRVNADTGKVKFCHAVPGRDIAGICCALQPCETFREVDHATPSFHQPCTEVELCSVEVAARCET